MAGGSPDDLRFLPERVARQPFASSVRGYDRDEVRAFLIGVADELRMLRERTERLQHELDDVRALTSHEHDFDEAHLTEVLGEETARVLAAAREAAGQIKAKAEENLARMLREGQDELARRRQELEMELAGRREEIEQEGERIRAEATVIRREGERAAEAELEAARERGREMVAEAQLVRERVLKDLARRRRLARQQIEQLRAGRERLLEAYQVVRQTLDQATEELTVAMPEARLAAELAARRAAEEEESSVEDLEAEMAAARATELPIIEDGPAAETSVEPAEEAREDASSAENAEADARVVFAPGVHPVSDLEAEADTPAPEGDASAPGPDEGDPEPLPPPPVLEVVEDPPSLAEPPSDIVEERRSSTLRLFRRRSHERAPETPPEPEAPAAAEEEAETEVGAFREPEPFAEPPEPETVAEPAPAAPVEELTTPPPDVEDVDEAAAPEPAAVAEPEAPEEPEPPAPATPATPPDDRTIDELFARMRAEREDAVARARDVLAEREPRAEPAEAGAAPEEPSVDEVTAEAPTATVPDEATEVPLVPGEPPSPLERRDEALAPVEHALARRLKRVLSDDQNEVLDSLRRRGAGVAPEAVLPALDAHVERFQSALLEGLHEAWRAGVDLVGVKAEPLPEDVPQLADDVVAEATAELVAPLRERLERALGESDVDVDELGERVRSCYREWRTERAEVSARHLAVTAFTAGVYAAAPDGSRLCWLVDHSVGPCPDADDNALAGPVPKGQPFPTGHLRPPAHAGCRCLAVVEPQ